MSERSPFVIDPDWLQANLGRPGLSIVDASWYLSLIHISEPTRPY